MTTWGTVSYINVQEYSTLSREGIKLIVLVNIHETITVSHLFNICNDLRGRAVWDRMNTINCGLEICTCANIYAISFIVLSHVDRVMRMVLPRQTILLTFKEAKVLESELDKWPDS